MTRTNLLLTRLNLLFTILLTVAAASQAQIQPPFNASYTLTNLGSPPGVPGSYGGVTFLDSNNLLIEGCSEDNGCSSGAGAIYEIGVARDGSGHITGFVGTASLYASAPTGESGLVFGPGGVLFYSALPATLGEIKPGSTSPDKTVDLSSLGLCTYIGTVQFAPNGDLKATSFTCGLFYTLALSPDGSGTYNVTSVTQNSTIINQAEAVAYIPSGSPVFTGSNAMITQWIHGGGGIWAYSVDGSYDPTNASPQLFASLTQAFGETIDSVTNDLLVATWDYGAGPVYLITGFAPPGEQGAVGLSPASLNLGSVVVGSTSAAKAAVLTNSGTGPLTIHELTASGNYAETDTCADAVLAPSATCTISVTITPTVAGTIAGAVTIVADAPGSPFILALTGKGTYPVTAAPASISFGSQAVGVTSGPKTVTLTNSSASSQGFSFVPSANYTAVGSGKTACTGILAAKAKCTLSVTFTPTANGTVAGALSIAGAGFATQVVALTGAGTGGGTSPLSFSPATVSISSTLVGMTSAAKTLTVTNSSGSTVNITNFTAIPEFTVIGTGTTPCGGALGAGASCTVAVTFSPAIAAKISGALVLMDDNASVGTQVVGLSGTGVLPVTLAPASLTFSAQTVGTTSPVKTITLTNNSTATVNLLSTVASGNYSVGPGSKTPCGSSLASKKKCRLSVTFTPTNKGTVKGAVTVAHDANGSPQVVGLSGTGQ